jgi:hypothetical protein
MPSRNRRGSETEQLVTQFLNEHGWPNAEPVGAGRSGPDITGTPGLGFEVKARRQLDLNGWLRQASAGAARPRPGGGAELDFTLPLVVHRPDGFGAASVASWPATFRLEHAVWLMRQAGYGEPAPL